MEERYRHIHKYENFISLLEEGLIHTYPILTTIKLLTRVLSELKIVARMSPHEPTNTIFLKGYSSTFYGKNLKSLVDKMATCGYFTSTFEFYDKNDNYLESIIYRESKNDEEYNKFFKEVNNSIKNSFFTQITIESTFNKRIENIPNKLYHVTSYNEKKIKSIKSVGLLQKNLNKKANHPMRIHLGYKPDVIEGLASEFSKKGEYVLFEIDTDEIGLNNLKLKDYIKLYDDPDFTGSGCYTYDNIPSNCIKELSRFNTEN